MTGAVCASEHRRAQRGGSRPTTIGEWRRSVEPTGDMHGTRRDVLSTELEDRAGSLTEIDMGRVQDRVVIVTGGAGGIGAAACRAIASEGGKVVVADLDESAARSVADAIAESGGAATSMYQLLQPP